MLNGDVDDDDVVVVLLVLLLAATPAAPLARVLSCGHVPVRLAAAKAVRDLGDAVLLGEVSKQVGE